MNKGISDGRKIIEVDFDDPERSSVVHHDFSPGQSDGSNVVNMPRPGLRGPEHAGVVHHPVLWPRVQEVEEEVEAIIIPFPAPEEK